MNIKFILIIVVTLICFFIIGIIFLVILPAKFDNECKNRVFIELKDDVEFAKKSVIGIIPESKNEN